MSFEIVRSDDFTREFKRLFKKYRSLADDYEAFIQSLKMNVVMEMVKELGL